MNSIIKTTIKVQTAIANTIAEIKKRPKLAFACQALGYYALMMILYLYFMLANLSSAPKFVYTQF